MFLEEFSKYLEKIIPSDGKLLVVGDFNFHLDDAKNNHSESFTELLKIFCLWQHVPFSTHSKGHILDLIITAESDFTVSSVQFSDHFSILCNLLCSKPPIVKKKVEYQKLNQINVTDLKQDTLSEDFGNDQDSTLGVVTKYNSCLSKLLDKHAAKKSYFQDMIHPKKLIKGNFSISQTLY